MLKNIFLKEYRSYLFSPVGYVFATLLLGISSWMYFADYFVINQAQIETYILNISYLMGIFIPAFFMATVSDEIKNGTWEILLTTKLTEEKLVAGKFLGAISAFATFFIGIVPVIVINFLLGKPDVGVVISQLVGLFLLACVYISVTIFASALVKQGIIAFFIATTVIIINSLFSQEAFTTRLPGNIAVVLERISWQGYMTQFTTGLVRLSSLCVLLASTCIFLILAVARLKQRNE